MKNYWLLIKNKGSIGWELYNSFPVSSINILEEYVNDIINENEINYEKPQQFEHQFVENVESH